MSDSNKVTRKKSVLGRLAGIFRKKKKETSSSRSPSQGQTNSHASGEEELNQGTSKSSEHGIYRQVITSDATSSHESPSVSSIDPAHVLVTPASGDKSTNNITSTSQTRSVVNDENNSQTIGKDTSEKSNLSSSNTTNKTGNKFLVESELIESFNQDVRIKKLKINNTDDKILINQRDNDVKIDLNSGKGEGEGEKIPIDESNEGKISSELMKKKWFNNENLDEIRMNSFVVITSTEKENIEENSNVETKRIELKSEEAGTVTNTMILEETHIKVEQHEGEFSRDESQILIEVERNERKPEDCYFTTGKFASYFLLEIERQYYDPSQVYAMVRYRDSEDSDDSDSEGSEFKSLKILIIIELSCYL